MVVDDDSTLTPGDLIPNSVPAGGLSQGEDRDPTALLKALQQQRAATEAAQKELKERKAAQSDLEKQVERLKGIDPDKYQELLTRQQQLEEEDLRRGKQWDTLKGTYEKQKGELTAKVTEWQGKYERILASQAVKDAFTATGGLTDVQDFEGESIAPLDLLTQFFGNRVTVDGDRVTLLDRYGKPETIEGRNKSLTEKMLELKRGSMGSLFAPENRNAGTGSTPSTIRADGSGLIIYTQEQARAGKADLKLIAQGKAIIR
jgi:hypothetical protein